MNTLARNLEPGTFVGVILGIGVLFLALAVAAEEYPERHGQAEQTVRVEQYASAGPLFLADLSIDAIRALAPIAREDTEILQSWHDAESWTATTRIQFDGLRLIVLEFHDSAEVGILDVVIESAQWPMRGGVGVGVTAQDVISHFGPPGQSSESALTYFGDSSSIEFRITEGVVTAIQIAYDWC